MAGKRYRRGTHRAAPPGETLARVRPFLGRMGITRIADVTGLDRVGLPVVMVVRPGSRSVAVSQGKGLDGDAAAASGVMEAVEAWHAESMDHPLVLASLDRLRATHELLEIARLPLRQQPLDAQVDMLWIEGRDLMAEGAPVWLPHQLVHLNYTLPAPPGAACFYASSNGLAAGNTPEEALVHALCEVIERDASALWRVQPRCLRNTTRIDPESIADLECLAVLDRLETADLAVGIWDMTADTGIAAFHVEIVERNERRPLLFGGPSSGQGCHPTRRIALLRALTEACQSRLTVISGARDDLDGVSYRPAEERVARKRQELACLDGALRPFAAVPDFESDDFAADLHHLLHGLRAAGVTQVAAVDLTRPDMGLPVVRVVVPGLETNPDHPLYRPGVRASRQAARIRLLPVVSA
jgi:ribosomal protein S12 methylthiotransferase accessory factor